MNEEVSLTPGVFPEGPKRDAARAARDAFHRWLRESPAPEAVEYRNAVAEERYARARRSKARTRARSAFKRQARSG